jgi:hypothetical protein
MSPPCPRCKAPTEKGVAGAYFCAKCQMMLPSSGAAFVVEANGARVHEIGGYLMTALRVIQQTREVSEHEMLVALFCVTGFKARSGGVELRADVPLGLQMPALMTGYEAADELIEERKRARKED